MNNEELKSRIHQLGTKYLYVHSCSMCGYKCGFYLDIANDKVAYDNGCFCVKYSGLREASWDEIYKIYESESDKEAILKKWELIQ